MKLRVGLVYDLRSEYLAEGFSEEDVGEFDSDETIHELEKALKSLGYRTDRIGNARALCNRLVAGDRWDLVFNIAEGLKGRCREAQVPAVLELYDIPYTMSDPLVNAVTLDKAAAKRLIRDAGIDTARFHVVAAMGDIAGVRLKYPLFVKPLAEGTGKGIDQKSKINNAAELRKACRRLLKRFAQPVLVEEYLPGREFTVGVLGSGRRAKVLGSMEVMVKPTAGGTVYSYETKEMCKKLVDYTFVIETHIRRKVEKLALQSYLALECRDCGRVDIRMDADGKPAFMEVNTLPGLHPTHSDLPMIATSRGMSYKKLIGAIIKSAFSRAGKR